MLMRAYVAAGQTTSALGALRAHARTTRRRFRHQALARDRSTAHRHRAGGDPERCSIGARRAAARSRRRPRRAREAATAGAWLAIDGEPGIGKSTLAEALAERIATRPHHRAARHLRRRVARVAVPAGHRRAGGPPTLVGPMATAELLGPQRHCSPAARTRPRASLGWIPRRHCRRRHRARRRGLYGALASTFDRIAAPVLVIDDAHLAPRSRSNVSTSASPRTRAGDRHHSPRR